MLPRFVQACNAREMHPLIKAIKRVVLVRKRLSLVEQGVRLHCICMFACMSLLPLLSDNASVCGMMRV